MAGMWGRREICRVKERTHLEDLGIDGRTILKCILNRMVGCGLDLWWHTVGLCEHGDEHSGLLKCREFTDLIRNY
jgi:hypothetical protein